MISQCLEFSSTNTSMLTIIADDLTGAADSAARCRHAGLASSILLDVAAPGRPAGAVAISTDSRHLSAEAAAIRVQTAVAALADASSRVWYKKIDSTLRGNLGAELDAMLAELARVGQQPCALVCPAFPAQRRGLRNGHLEVFGSPERGLHLPSLLRDQSELAIESIGLRAVRAGKRVLASALQQAYARGANLLVVDGLEESDLDALLAARTAGLPQALLCGSAGLVGRLACGLAAAKPAEKRPSARSRVQRLLIVVGSGSTMAHRQIECMSALAQVTTVVVDARTPVQQPPANRSVVLFHQPKPAPNVRLDGLEARRCAARMAKVVRIHLQRMRPEVLILAGGDTAVQVLAQLGVRRLDVRRELLPGMPLTQTEPAVLCAAAPLRVVLKAGNHGDRMTLVTLVEMLHAKSKNP